MAYHLDGGYRSRKMVMAYAVLVLMSLGYLATGVWPALATVYGEFVMGLLAATTIYSGANSSVKWMSLKNGAVTDAAPAAKPAKPAEKLPAAPRPPQD